ncbi:hypothetical protein J2R99_000448 [Rhodopseudomonas julia]|uniref:Uncharacterized protein n=1 Tax=Rhodopseudomonas julia TaxID=200617 RepID=A0ABU0C259_9BRAD|nr:hypothetical protein [Rhodopseudomonas julia]MDQ0324599.1 hypothetical protein [Rhodopseudomonas julia]
MFEPWVGEKYSHESGFAGGRLLILGESHYSKRVEEIGETPEKFTENVVRYFGIERRHNFFGKVQEVVTGVPRKQQTAADKKVFWNAVAFYNWVPTIVDGRPVSEGGARRRPTDDMFRAGGAPFQVIRRRLEPRAVIVCGLTLWDHVAPTLDSFGHADRDVIFYDDGNCMYARISHPSTPRFDTRKWCRRVGHLLELSAQPRQLGRKIRWQEWDKV